MSKFEKLLHDIKNLDNDLRVDEIRKVMEYYGYSMFGPSGGSSHKTFRKKGCPPVTIPQHEHVKIAHIRMIKEIIEGAEDDSKES